MRYLPFVAYFVLVVYALIDCARSEDDERSGMPKILWMVLIVIAPLFGAIAWLIVSRVNRRAQTPGHRPSHGSGSLPGRSRPSAPRAPDDDPEFLWRIEQERRRAAGRDGGPGHGTPGHGTQDGGPGPAGPRDDAGSPGSSGSGGRAAADGQPGDGASDGSQRPDDERGQSA